MRTSIRRPQVRSSNGEHGCGVKSVEVVLMDLATRELPMTARTEPMAPRITPATPTRVDAAASAAGEFLDRELGWLEFNRRVLAQALDERTPLLERVRFL